VPERSEDLVARAEVLVAKGDDVLSTYKRNPPNVIGFPTLDAGAFTEWRVQTLAFLIRILRKDHAYVKNFEAVVEAGHPSHVKSGQGILRALAEDLGGGYLVNVQTLVAGEVFSDLAELAQHLLESGYKDPAASLAGAVLEDGLRRIAANNGVKLKSREDLSSLNTKCADGQIYSRLVQKKVILWMGVRNHADHGEFGEYTEQDVREMIDGVTGFLSTYLV
jgi:hypothetical protein